MRPLLARLGPCLLALLPAVSATPLQVQRPDPEALLRTVRRERVITLQALWVEASPARRERALARLRAGAQGGRSPAAPSLAALVDAGRWLAGGPAPVDPGGWEQRLADSLDLVVVPGAFEATDAERGEPLTVLVQPLFPTPVAEAFEVRLLWTSPSGEELVARTEPVEPEHFARGFEMYLRAPPSEPGRWRLTLALSRDGREWRGHPVPVDAVAELGRRLTALGDGDERDPEPSSEIGWVPPGSPARAAGDLQRWVRTGLRAPAVSVETLLHLAEGTPGAPTAGSSGVEPLRTGGVPVGWRLGPAGAQVGVLLVPSARERPEDLLAGVAGERWVAAAAAGGFELVAAALPLLPTGDEMSALALLEELRRERGWTRTSLVAVGDAAMLSAAALATGPGPPPGSVVLLHEGPLLPRADPRLDLAVLSIEPSSPAAGELELRPEGPAWRRVQRSEPRPLVELELPDLVSSWLRSSDSTAGER